MYQIPSIAVAKWKKLHGLAIPESIDTTCPFLSCNRHVTLSLEHFHHDGLRGCFKRVDLFLMMSKKQPSERPSRKILGEKYCTFRDANPP
jgi:hypothetical protein